MALYRYPRNINNVNLHPGIMQFQFFSRDGFVKSTFSDTVQLYSPEQANSPSTVSYDTENFGMAGKKMAEMLRSGTNAQDVKGTISGMMDKMKHQAIFNTTAEMVNKVNGIFGDSNLTGQGLGGQVAGKIANPYMTVVFRGVDFRKFSFTFKFTALSEDDCTTINNIIKTFRKHALPYYADQTAFLNYPSECGIAYFWKGKLNEFLPRFKRAVCTGVDVDYTSGGTFAMFRNGMPIHITMSTTWQEVEIVTREDVESYNF